MESGIIIEWDWKEQPDWEKINRALVAQWETDYLGCPILSQVETGSDSYAVVLHDGHGKVEPQEYYDTNKFK